MAYQQINSDKSAGVLTITFNDPDKLIAFTFKMLEEVNQGALVQLNHGQGRACRWNGREPKDLPRLCVCVRCTSPSALLRRASTSPWTRRGY
jgi:hypothetical protein